MFCPLRNLDHVDLLEVLLEVNASGRDHLLLRVRRLRLEGDVNPSPGAAEKYALAMRRSRIALQSANLTRAQTR